MATSYAAGTKVPFEKSLYELRSVLTKAGATHLAQATDTERNREVLYFRVEGISYQITVPMPDSEADIPAQAKKRATGARALGGHIQAERARRMRAMVLYVKARLVAVDEGLTEFTKAFVGDIVRADGRTVADAVAEEVRLAVSQGRAPKALPMFGGGDD